MTINPYSPLSRRAVLKGMGSTISAAPLVTPEIVAAIERPSEAALRKYRAWLEEEASLLSWRLNAGPTRPPFDFDARYWRIAVDKGEQPGPETRALPILRSVGLDVGNLS